MRKHNVCAGSRRLFAYIWSDSATQTASSKVCSACFLTIIKSGIKLPGQHVHTDTREQRETVGPFITGSVFGLGPDIVAIFDDKGYVNLPDRFRRRIFACFYTSVYLCESDLYSCGSLVLSHLVLQRIKSHTHEFQPTAL